MKMAIPSGKNRQESKMNSNSDLVRYLIGMQLLRISMFWQSEDPVDFSEQFRLHLFYSVYLLQQIAHILLRIFYLNRLNGELDVRIAGVGGIPLKMRHGQRNGERAERAFEAMMVNCGKPQELFD